MRVLLDVASAVEASAGPVSIAGAARLGFELEGVQLMTVDQQVKC